MGVHLTENDKGVANGLATLDGSGKIPANQLPVFGTERHYQERTISASTTGANIIYTTLTTTSLPAGTYVLIVSMLLQNTSTAGDWQVDITEGTNAAGLNTSLLSDILREEGLDSGSDQRWPRTIEREVALTSGIKNINIEMDQFNSGTFTMFYGSIRLYRVA